MILNKLLTPWRLKIYPRWFLVPLFVPIVIAVLTSNGSSMVTGRLGGDLPAFYGAGTIVNDGNLGQLYEWEVQAAAEEGLFGKEEGVFQVFAYPPFVAHSYSPLAHMPYRWAYAIHTTLMLSAIAAAIAVLRGILPRLQGRSIEVFALAAAFYPMYRAATGGQNTAVTLLILAVGYRALHNDQPVAAGAIMGLLLYKPQFALPVIGLLFLRDRRSLIGAAISGAVLWTWGALLAGAGWVNWWFDHAREFNSADQETNGSNSINLIGFAERIFGVGSLAAYAVGGVLAMLTVLALMKVWRSKTVPLDLQVAALTCGVLLIPLHIMFYDGGLLILPLAILANRHGRDALPALVFIFVLALTGAFATNWGFSTIFVAVALAALWVFKDIRESLQTPSDAALRRTRTLATHSPQAN